jgi:hypothetical protein
VSPLTVPALVWAMLIQRRPGEYLRENVWVTTLGQHNAERVFGL